MAEYFVIEDYPDFASTSRRARELALQFKETTSIHRDGSMGWEVRVSANIISALAIEYASSAEIECARQESKLELIEHEHLIESEPGNKLDSQQSHEEESESLTGWGSGDHDSVGDDTDDWSDSFEDKDSSFWEDFMGGPDY